MNIKTVKKQNINYLYNFTHLELNKVKNNELNNIIPSIENDYIDKSENKRIKIEPKSNLIFSENDMKLSGFENNGKNIVGNSNNIIQNNRNFNNTDYKSNNNKIGRINKNEDLCNTYNNDLFKKVDNDKIDNIKYNYINNNINQNQNFNNISKNNNKIENSYLTRINNEQNNNKNINKYNNNDINENILLKSKISSMEQKISQYEKQIKDFDNYINIINDFFNNINQISMNQLNIDMNQFNNKIIDVNLFKNILNKIQSYIIYLQKELNTFNSNNYYLNEQEPNYNNEYNKNYQNYTSNKEQFEIYKTLEDRINVLEKELNLQKQNFIVHNFDTNKVNGTEKIKKKNNSKKKFKPLKNIYELPKEEPKSTNMRNRQKINKLNKKQEKINNTNDNNQMNKIKNNKILSNSNRKYTYRINDKENKKRSITPLNSRLKKYFK